MKMKKESQIIVVRGKCIALNACIRKEGKSQVSNLNFLKNLQKEPNNAK